MLLDTNVVSKLIRKTYNSADSVPEFDVSRLASYPSRMPRPVATIELTDSERAEPHWHVQLTTIYSLPMDGPKTERTSARSNPRARQSSVRGLDNGMNTCPEIDSDATR